MKKTYLQIIKRKPIKRRRKFNAKKLAKEFYKAMKTYCQDLNDSLDEKDADAKSEFDRAFVETRWESVETILGIRVTPLQFEAMCDELQMLLDVKFPNS